MLSEIFSVPSRSDGNVGLDFLGVIFNPTLIYGETFNPAENSFFMYAVGYINIIIGFLAIFLFVVIVIYLFAKKGKEILSSEKESKNSWWDPASLLLYLFLIPLPNAGMINIAQLLYIKSEVRSFLAADWLVKKISYRYADDKRLNSTSFKDANGNMQSFNGQKKNIADNADKYVLDRFVNYSRIFLCAEGLKTTGMLDENNVRGTGGDNRQLQAIRACKVPAEAAETLQPYAKYSINTYGVGGGLNTNYERRYVTEMACHYQAFKTYIAPHLQYGSSKLELKNTYPAITEIALQGDGLDKSTMKNHDVWKGLANSIESCLVHSQFFSHIYVMGPHGLMPKLFTTPDYLLDKFSKENEDRLKKGWIFYPINALKMLEDESEVDKVPPSIIGFDSFFSKSKIAVPDKALAFGDELDDVNPSVTSAHEAIQKSVETYKAGLRTIALNEPAPKILSDSTLPGGALLQTQLLLNKTSFSLDKVETLIAADKDVNPRDMARYRTVMKGRDIRQNVRDLRKLFLTVMSRVRYFSAIVDKARAVSNFTAKTIAEGADKFGELGRGSWVESVTKFGAAVTKTSSALALNLIEFMAHALDTMPAKFLLLVSLLVYATEYLPMLAVLIAASILMLQIGAWSIGLSLSLFMIPIPKSRVGETAWRFTLAIWLTPMIIVALYTLGVTILDYSTSFALSFILENSPVPDGVFDIEKIGAVLIDFFSGDFAVRLIIGGIFYIFMTWQVAKFIILGHNLIMDKIGLTYRNEGFEDGFSRLENMIR
ncbi:hypothetical protein P5U49_000155 [Neisseria gonorrhoeae]